MITTSVMKELSTHFLSKSDKIVILALNCRDLDFT